MIIENAVVESIKQLEEKTYLIKARSETLANSLKPGQFCNIKVNNSTFPLLRRPFSICDVENDSIFFMFDVHGEGTEILSRKMFGDVIDVLGPLGNGFNLDDNFDTAVIAAGGIGVAPFPYLIRKLGGKKKMISFLGGKSKENIIEYGLKNLSISTDDGSVGFHGNVIDLMESNIERFRNEDVKIFGCGPNPMLRALKDFSIKYNFNCEVSTECAMACGFGICQGCPIEKTDADDKYLLVCKDGPVFNVKDVVL
ncbi:MAG: dihydroorotate dehydrogenase electron transfer subunit [Melioribacteraceae bacterium]|nr:dihydroorotate dehydrogenase electron transfer subunit [Melioribacteraceae bacterium]MCF8354867.1 dihydroorotate dehydrogenase electron transfer subunit [Melioribacteraceae bacterium]MCF8392974.1 dihydroorotate dehydrogenase electron transfer subunit [Melioribacteraceae bacterium]MCF8417283.1 dihydroorotate dehydrogenase electron transfer subunit [Melioribacteraceae bacterium]